MPRRAPSPCATLGCPELTTTVRCAEHQRAQWRDEEVRWKDPRRKKLYRSKRWQGVRRVVLSEQPWCQVAGCTNMATDVDHINPLRDDGDPYDRKNLQALCRMHHSQKTAREVWDRKA